MKIVNPNKIQIAKFKRAINAHDGTSVSFGAQSFYTPLFCFVTNEAIALVIKSETLDEAVSDSQWKNSYGILIFNHRPERIGVMWLNDFTADHSEIATNLLLQLSEVVANIDNGDHFVVTCKTHSGEIKEFVVKKEQPSEPDWW